MKKTILILFSLFLFSCTNAIFNAALQKAGAYDSAIKLEKWQSNSKEIVFFPMIHIGTEAFYDDVKKKTDSLSALGFIFYYEQVQADSKDTVTLRKYRKINKQPFTQSGYKELIDSVLTKRFDVKLRKKIISQPDYPKLGVNSSNGRNADVKLIDLVSLYENKYKPIVLQDCDIKTSIYKPSTCDDNKEYPKIPKEMIIDFRNDYIVNLLMKENHKKIAIIYGKEHMSGIKNQLTKNGFK